MDPFNLSDSHVYILVCVDYVTKWVEAIACGVNDAQTVTNFMRNNVFSRFGVPIVFINDGGFTFTTNTWKIC